MLSCHLAAEAQLAQVLPEGAGEHMVGGRARGKGRRGCVWLRGLGPRACALAGL